LAAADGKLALFVDGATGNVGIGTTTPGAKLTVSGANNASKDHESGMNAGGQLAIKGNAPQIDFIDTDHNDWSIHVNSNKMYFIRQPWEYTDLVLDGGGKVGIGTAEPQAKLQIVHTNQDPNGGAIMLGPTDQSNLRLGYNQTYSWIQSHGARPLAINSIGNQVGIGTTNPGNKFTIEGAFNQYKDPESGIANGGLVALKGNAPQIDFIDTEHGDWAIHVNEGRMYFIREPWEHQDLVLDGRGNIGIGSSVPQAKLNIRELTGTPATALKGTLLLDHEDAGGASSIVFSSKVNRGSDYAFIEYRDRNAALPLDPNVPHRGEASLLTIGVQNDAEDHIALMPSGNVGVGTTTPTCKLDVNGDSYISGCLGIRAGSEIFFSGHGQIRSLDDSHRILFRKDENKMELREKGDIVFSSGSAEGQETSKMVIHGSGNVGIGSTKPEFKLDVNGTVRLGGFTTEEKDEWPYIVWCRDLAKGWDEGLYKHGKHYGFFGRAGFGVHIHESRRFELFSTNARPLLGVEGGTGNTSIRGNVKVNGCITPSAGNSESTGILFPKDPGGGTSDAAWIRYYVRSNESCTLEIGIANDNDDQLFLNASGGVRCSGTLTQLSDINVKTNISQLPNPLEDLLKLNGVSYAWKRSLSDEPTCLGLIAQEVAEVFPQLVESDHDGFLHLNYLGFIPILIESIKAQQKQLLQIQAAL